MVVCAPRFKRYSKVEQTTYELESTMNHIFRHISIDENHCGLGDSHLLSRFDLPESDLLDSVLHLTILRQEQCPVNI